MESVSNVDLSARCASGSGQTRFRVNTMSHKAGEFATGARWTQSVAAQGFGIFALILAAAFFRPLGALAAHAISDGLDSYVLLMPLVVGYLIHLKRDQLPDVCQPSPGWSALPFAVGILAVGATWIPYGSDNALSSRDLLTLQTLGFVCWLIAGAFVFFGREWMKLLAFPAAILLFMVPLPEKMVTSLETASKLASTEVAHVLFLASGTPVLREGAIFQLPGIAIEVAQQCSGIRSSLMLFVTALLASHLFLASGWRRCLFVAVVIPLGILRNGVRILVLGMLASQVNPELLDSAIHKRGGPVFFLISLIPLAALLWWLRRGEKRLVQS